MIYIRALSAHGVCDAAVSDIQRLLNQLSKNPRLLTRNTLSDICTEHTVLVAMDDAIPSKPIVGMATLVVIEQLVGTRGRVEDVVVDREYRRQGIARRLMEELHETAKRHGVGKLALSSRPDRDAAIPLYLKLGYRLAETNAYVIELKI